MGKVGWYSLAVAVLCAGALISTPWTVRFSLNTAAAEQTREDGLLSLLPEAAPLDLNSGSTATEAGLASNPLAGAAPAATKRLPNAAPITQPPAGLLNSRQQELSLNTSAAVAEKAAPPASQPAITKTKLSSGIKPAPPQAAKPAPQATRATKPVKPASKATAKTKSEATAKPKPASTAKAKPAQATRNAETAASFIEDIDLPETTFPASTNEPAPSLRELFTDEEIDNPLTDSAVVANAGTPGQTAGVPPISAGQGTMASVIDTRHPEPGANPPDTPTLGQILRGEAQDDSVGSSLSGYNPIRSGAMVLLVLALLFAGAWLAKKVRNPLPGFSQKTLSVIETVSIGPGRQLIIVEMNNDALVLGVTPHSINMLDKVPLTVLNGSYQRTVNSIIEREENALPADWQERPLFTPPAIARPAPALATATTYGPSGRMTVSQARQSNFNDKPTRNGNGGLATSYLQERNTKAELIDRIRQQLSNLER